MGTLVASRPQIGQTIVFGDNGIPQIREAGFIVGREANPAAPPYRPEAVHRIGAPARRPPPEAMLVRGPHAGAERRLDEEASLPLAVPDSALSPPRR